MTLNATPPAPAKSPALPFDIRQELNERLEENEPSQRLVEWLNAQPAVRRSSSASLAPGPIFRAKLERLESAASATGSAT